MAWSSVYIVVADKFGSFCEADNRVVSESNIIDRIVSEEKPNCHVDLILGQGVDRANVYCALQQVDPHEVHFSIVSGKRKPRAVKRLAHKSNPDNILVSYPRQKEENLFELDLYLDPACEFFGDHMTGLHIQGMALMEAARQSFLVVTEEFYLRGVQEPYYFVIKSFDTRFVSFVFPVGATVQYEVKTFKSTNGRFGFSTEVKIMQSDAVCAEFDIAFTAFTLASIADRERVLAQTVVERLIAHETNATSAPPLEAVEQLSIERLAANV